MIMTFWYPDQKMSKIIMLRILFFASKLVSLLLCYAQCLGRCQKNLFLRRNPSDRRYPIFWHNMKDLLNEYPFCDSHYIQIVFLWHSATSYTVPRFFSGTGTGTFFKDQFFSVPVPVLFSRTNFFRYQYFFPVPVPSKKGRIPGTVTKPVPYGTFLIA